jgi:hypothetical protein
MCVCSRRPDLPPSVYPAKACAVNRLSPPLSRRRVVKNGPKTLDSVTLSISVIASVTAMSGRNPLRLHAVIGNLSYVKGQIAGADVEKPRQAAGRPLEYSLWTRRRSAMGW